MVHLLNRPAPLAVIVEQCRATCQTAASDLESCGWAVHAAGSIDDMLTPPGATPSATDICVPDASLFVLALDSEGATLEAVQWLRSCERWSRAPVILLAAADEQADVAGDGLITMHKPLAEGDVHHVLSTIFPQGPGSGLDLGAMATLNLGDLFSREVSRARRGSYPFSVLLQTLAWPGGSTGEEWSTAAGFRDWSTRVESALRRSLREADLMVVPEPGAAVMLLPFTDADGLACLETRLQDLLRTLVHQLHFAVRTRPRLIAAGASFPVEASDWRSLASLAWRRLEDAAGGAGGSHARVA